jgi:hypothetical protein
MVRISSRSTVFYKRVLPIAWFGTTTVIAVCAAGLGVAQHAVGNSVPAFLITAGLYVVGYVVFRIFVFGLVDEVWDCGDSLIDRNKGIRITVALRDCMNVSHTWGTNPQQIRLMLRDETELGTEIAFIPIGSMTHYSTSPIVKDLIVRIDEAKCGRPV